MEKILLVMALLGSAHLAYQGMGKLGRLLLAFMAPTGNSTPGLVLMPDARPMAVREDGAEDWSSYDIPAFIRRGIEMPQLEPVQIKAPKTRKRRKPKAETPAIPAASPTSDTAVFEIVA